MDAPAICARGASPNETVGCAAGVGAVGCAAGCAASVPHVVQNLVPGRSSLPQLLHRIFAHSPV
jgi:hypothetical protein